MTGQYHQFHPFHVAQYALELSYFEFLNIVSVNVDVSLTENVLNDLLIVFFLRFMVDNAKLSEMASFLIFNRLLYP